jgi:predicted acetyltransferase
VTPSEEVIVRRIDVGDTAAVNELSHLAFGTGRDPNRALSPTTRWGVFDGDGRLMAKATDRTHQHWFGGTTVPASGVAGVAVAPEARGRGLAGLVLRRLLTEARGNGAAIATLFRTAPALYRRLGFEHAGTLNWYTTPTLALAGLRVPDGMTLRAAGAADVPTISELYRDIARTRNGMLERSGPLFVNDPERYLRAVDGITLAVGPDGCVEGYCRWDRGTGSEGATRLTVWDLIATTGRATRALLAGIGSWSSVLATVALRLPDPDPVRWLLPVGDLTVERQQPWMLKILDADAAVRARGWPQHLSAVLDLTLLDGDRPAGAAPGEDGRCRWNIDGGKATVEPGGPGTIRLDVRGLSALYAGAGSAAMLRHAGLLSGGDAGADALLDAATAAPAPALLDFF